MRTNGRFRYSLHGLMIVTAILAVGFAYARFAIRDYAAWEPYAIGHASAEREAEYKRSQQIEKVGALALPPVLLGVGFLAGCWVMRKRRNLDANERHL